MTILSGAAILSLLAAAAHAQSEPNGPPAASGPVESSLPHHSYSSDKDEAPGAGQDGADANASGAVAQDKSGYDAKDSKQKADRWGHMPGYSRSTGKTPENESGNLVPFGPPR